MIIVLLACTIRPDYGGNAVEVNTYMGLSIGAVF